MKRRFSTLLALCLVIIIITLGVSTVPMTAVQAQDGENEPEPYTTGVFPRAMAFDGENVWVANWVDNTVTILDGATGEQLKTIETNFVGREPVALAWDNVTGHMWVASYADSRVSKFDKTGEFIESLDNNNHGVQQPIALLYDGAHLWVVNQGTGARNGSVLKIEAATTLKIGEYDVGHYPTAITWDLENIWVANGEDNSLSVFEADTGRTVGRVAVNDFPMSLAFDGVHIWVAHYDGSIALVSHQSRQIDESIVLDELPGRTIELYYAFERVWITNADGESIAKIQARSGELSTTETAGQFPGTMVATTNEQLWIANWLDYQITVINISSSSEGFEQGTAVANNAGALLVTPTITMTPTLVPIVNCNPNMPSRLRPGDRAEVDDEGDTASLRLRDGVGTSGTNVLGAFPPGSTFDVLGGPQCDDESNAWYNIRLDDGTEGWFIEALGEDYTIGPLASE